MFNGTLQYLIIEILKVMESQIILLTPAQSKHPEYLLMYQFDWLVFLISVLQIKPRNLIKRKPCIWGQEHLLS